MFSSNLVLAKKVFAFVFKKKKNSKEKPTCPIFKLPNMV